jgi:hypothetical protein
MHIRKPAILAGGAALALVVGLGSGLLAVSPVDRAVAHAPGLASKADLLPAPEAAGPTQSAPAAAPMRAYAQRFPQASPQYAQQAAHDEPAAIAWPDERAAPAPVDEPQPDENGTRDVAYPPASPPYAFGPPGDDRPD